MGVCYPNPSNRAIRIVFEVLGCVDCVLIGRIWVCHGESELAARRSIAYSRKCWRSLLGARYWRAVWKHTICREG